MKNKKRPFGFFKGKSGPKEIDKSSSANASSTVKYNVSKACLEEHYPASKKKKWI